MQFPRLVATLSAGKTRRGPREAQVPPFTGGEVAVRGGAARVANHLGNKRRQRGVAGEVVCVVDAMAPGLVCRSGVVRKLLTVCLCGCCPGRLV